MLLGIAVVSDPIQSGPPDERTGRRGAAFGYNLLQQVNAFIHIEDRACEPASDALLGPGAASRLSVTNGDYPDLTRLTEGCELQPETKFAKALDFLGHVCAEPHRFLERGLVHPCAV